MRYSQHLQKQLLKGLITQNEIDQIDFTRYRVYSGVEKNWKPCKLNFQNLKTRKLLTPYE